MNFIDSDKIDYLPLFRARLLPILGISQALKVYFATAAYYPTGRYSFFSEKV